MNRKIARLAASAAAAGLAAALVLQPAPNVLAVSSWNAATDFSAASNPNGPWSYGWSAAGSYAFNLDPNAVVYFGAQEWSPMTTPDYNPAVFFNPNSTSLSQGSPATNVIPPHSLAFHPGPNGQHALVRWTAPASGTFSVTATFTGEDTYGTTTDVEVLRNGSVAWQAEITGYQATQSYSGAALSLSAGDTIDFAVGDGTDGTFYNDTTGLSVQISAAADATPPTVSCAAPDGLWHASDVGIPCSASDPDSGLANPADASFSLTTNVPVGTETGNASTGTHQVCDAAGNCVTVGPIAGNHVDKKAPSITIGAPLAGTSYTLNAVATTSYSCTDGGSGVASCVGTVASGGALPTGTVGAQVFSVSATDKVGNGSKATAAYTVSFGVCALYDQTEVMPSGSVRPIKLELCDASGTDISSAATTVHATGVTLLTTDTSANLATPGNANPDNDFRYDSSLGTAGGYIYNLSTKGYAVGTYQLSFTATGDPTTHSVQFQLR